MKKFLVTAIVFCALIMSPYKADAAISWDWSFTNNNLLVGQSDTVTMLATLTNSSTAGETIGNLASGATAYLGFADSTNIAGYIFSFGPAGDLFSQFGTPINPGASKDFVFGKYTPVGNAPLGTYIAPDQKIELFLASNRQSLGDITNCYSWNVGSNHVNGCFPDGGSTVPEPASVMLLGGGLAGAFLRRRKSA